MWHMCGTTAKAITPCQTHQTAVSKRDVHFDAMGTSELAVVGRKSQHMPEANQMGSNLPPSVSYSADLLDLQQSQQMV